MRRLLFFAGCAWISAAAHAADVAVVLGGKYHSPISAYEIGPQVYLSAKEAGSIYEAQVYWYPVAGRVQMSVRGKTIQFFVNSADVKLGGKTIKMNAPALLRASQAWIPLEFLRADAFSNWAEADTAFDAKTLVLTVDRRSSLGPVRSDFERDHTRLSFELNSKLSFSASARGVNGIEVTVPFGTIDAPEQETIEDGLVSSYSVSQGHKAARLSIKLAYPALHWRASQLLNPRRVAVDIFQAEVVETASVAPTKSQAKEPARKRIVIDAGHGGKDSGAVGGRGVQEKAVNLLAAKELAKILREETGFDVALTRDDDTFVPLSARSLMANESKADLFISLHCNAARTAKNEGFEVYFLSEKASDPEAERLAELENSVVKLEGKMAQDRQADLLLNELAKTEYVNESSELAALVARAVAHRVDIENRGVKQAGFYVLRGTHAPAVLFEMAYITNGKDEVRLQSQRFRRQLVTGVYGGIIEYAKRKGWPASSAKNR